MDVEESERAIVLLKLGNPEPRGPSGGKGELDTWTLCEERHQDRSLNECLNETATDSGNGEGASIESLH